MDFKIKDSDKLVFVLMKKRFVHSYVCADTKWFRLLSQICTFTQPSVSKLILAG